MPQQIILRKGTAAAWTAAGTVVLAAGEPGFETNTGKLKIGDGTTAWTALDYVNPDFPTVPSNLADLLDVSSATPSVDQVLKWNGTAWAPAADATGGGGAGATTLDELTDVAILVPVTTNQVLAYNGSNWTNTTLATDTNTTYSLSAETSAGAAKIRLTPSSGAVDEIRLTGATGVAVSRVDADNITIAGTTYNVSAQDGTLIPIGGDAILRLTNSAAVNRDIKFKAGANIDIRKSNVDEITIASEAPQYSISASGATGGTNFRLTATGGATDDVKFANGTGMTIALTNENTITFNGPEYTMETAAAGSGATIRLLKTGTGVIDSTVFAPGSGISLALGTGVDANKITITNSGGTVLAATTYGATSASLAVYSDPTRTTVVGPTNSGLTYSQSTATLTAKSIAIVRENIYTSTNAGLTMAQYHSSSANATAFTFTRGRGLTQAAATAVQAGDQLGNIAFAGHDGSGGVYSAGIVAGVQSAPTSGVVPSSLSFITTNAGAPRTAARLTKEGYWKTDYLQALTTNGDLNIIANGTGTVQLPAGTKVGGVAIGTMTFAGSTANATTRAALTPSSGQVYIQLDNLHGYLWSGTAWVDLGVLQGPTGTTGPTGDPGATGATGAAGADGADGADGRTILNGTAAPTSGAGVDGDFWLDTITTTIYGPKAAGAWPGTGVSLVGPAGAAGADGADGAAGAAGAAGADGADGADGRTILNGTADPTSQGVNGDFYINTTTNTIFGPKAAGAWGTGVSLVGPAGADGADGADGAPGATGAAGTNGTNGQGVPTGGTTGQYLRKTSSTDYATAWDTLTLTDLGITDGTTGQVLTTNGSGGFTFTTVSGGGGGATNLDGLTDVVITGPVSTGQVLKYNGSNWVNGTDSTGAGGYTRAVLTGTTSTLADGAVGPVTITGYKAYALLKIQTSAAAWVRIYTSEAARIADASRVEGTDPTPGSGVIAEVITTGAQTVVISPGTIGFNDEGTPTTDIKLRVTNKSGSSAAITVTLTALQLEA
jgi:hypothetical protein